MDRTRLFHATKTQRFLWLVQLTPVIGSDLGLPRLVVVVDGYGAALVRYLMVRILIDELNQEQGSDSSAVAGLGSVLGSIGGRLGNDAAAAVLDPSLCSQGYPTSGLNTWSGSRAHGLGHPSPLSSQLRSPSAVELW